MSPDVRTDLDAIPAYVPGATVPGAVKLASNETTAGPLPSVAAAIAEAAARSLPVNALTRPGAAEAAEELDALYRELFGVPEPATAGTPPGSHGADSSLHAAYDLGYAVRP